MDTVISELNLGFNPVLNLWLGIITSFLYFAIFIKANQMYSRTGDRRLIVLAGGVFIAGLFEVFHFIYTFTSIDLASYFIFFSNLFYSISLFVPIFYTYKFYSPDNKNFKPKVYGIYLISAFTIIITGILLNSFESKPFQSFINFITLNPSMEIIDNALIIFAAFIFTDLRLTSGKSILSKFTLALIISGIGQIYLMTPEYLTSAYRLFIHIVRITALLLVFTGLKDFCFKPEIYSFKQRLLSFPALFLLIFYFIFITSSYFFFDIRFPVAAEIIFLILFISAIVAQYKVASDLTIPVSNLISGVEKFKPDSRPEKIQIISSDELGKLTEEINEITELNWKYTQELLTKQKQDNIRLLISNNIRSVLNSDEVLASIVNIIGTTFHPEQCIIYNLNSETDEICASEFEYRDNREIPSLKGIRLSKESRLESLDKKIGRKEIIIISDTEKDLTNEKEKKFFESLGIKSALILPLSYKAETLGFLALHFFTKKHLWSEETVNLISSVEPQISTAIYQARLYTSTSELARRESALKRIISSVLTSIDINEVYETVTREIGTLFNADKCVLKLYNPKKDKFETIPQEYRSNSNIPSMINIEFPDYIQHFFKKILITEKRPLVIENIDSCNIEEAIKSFIINQLKIRSFAAIPVYYKNEFLAILFVDHINQRHWSKEDINTLIPIANQLAIAIYQSRLFTKTQKAAEREQLLRQILISSMKSLDIKTILQEIVIDTGQLFGADRCFFAEYDDKKEEFLPIKNYQAYIPSLDIKNVVGEEFSKEELAPFKTIAMKDKEAIIINNINDVNISEASLPMVKKYRIKSFFATPIFYGDKALGVLILHYVKHYKDFSEDEIRLLTDISNQSAVIIYQGQLYNQINEAKNRESFLRNIINLVLTSDTLEEAAQNITFEVGNLFNSDRTVLRLFDIATKNFSVVIGEYDKSNDIPSIKGKMTFTKEFDNYLTRQFFDRKEILIIDNPDDPKYPDSFRSILKQWNIKTVLGFPIFYKDTLLAAIFIDYIKSSKMWKIEEIDFLKPIIQQISLGMHLFYLNDRLEKSLDNEKDLRNIIIRIRSMADHDQIYNYLLDQLTSIFNSNRGLHLHYNADGDLYVQNEVLKDHNLNPLINQVILSKQDLKEIIPDDFNKIIVINNVDDDIADFKLKDYLKSKNIRSFILYPTALKYSSSLSGEQIEEILGITLICCINPRIWSSDEISFFKLMIDAVSIIFLEVKQRQEIDEIKRTFIATLTHDLRSPIIAEQKALEFILTRKPETPLSSYSEYLEDIHKTNDELLRIVNNILSVYHFESGRFILNIEPNNLEEIINDVITTLKPLAKDQDSEIVTDIQENLPLIMIDKTEITRVLSNLTSNAIKHNRRGTKIMISAKKEGNKILVSISDNGEGIPESERANIFQRYPTAKRKIGAGLGLYLSKQIIEAHNEKIWFETKEGKGTTFFFTLPII